MNKNRASAKTDGEPNGHAHYASVRVAGTIAGSGGLRFRSASQFSNRCTTTKNVGANSTARQFEAIMPENTVMPIDSRPRRLDRGFQQRPAVAGMQFERHFDDQDRILGRQRDQQDQSDLPAN
jgi:hypothetical protein